jgi:hypothetical protein
MNGATGVIVLAVMSTAIFAVLGAPHLIYTIHDFGDRPKYFRPRDATLLASMRQTQTAIAPQGQDYWSGVVGFSLSHSLGVLLFALLIDMTAVYDINWLKPILTMIGLAFAFIAWRCWFRIPMVGCLIGTALMVAALVI